MTGDRARAARGLRALAAAALLAAPAACASGPRGVVDVRVEPAANPEGGSAFRIGRVRDARVFDQDPGAGTWTPSLAGDAVDDPDRAARAMARRRVEGNYASGDNISLPEGQTVAGVVAEAVGRGFREAGQRVLAPGDPGYDAAPAIDVDVIQFWGRMRPDLHGVRFDFRTQVFVTAPARTFREGGTVGASALVGSGGPGTGAWRKTFESGLRELSDRIRARLQPVPGG